MLCDCRSAFQRLTRAPDSEATTARSHLALRQLNKLEHTIVFQWMTGPAGINGNTEADKLAQTAVCQLTRIEVLPDLGQLGSNPQQSLEVEHLVVLGKRLLLSLGGLPRRKSTLLMRLRTSSTHTTQWITNHTSELDSTCPHCGVTKDILQGLVDCPSHADA